MPVSLLYPFRELGRTVIFGFHIGRLFLQYGASFKDVIDQMYAVGVRSLSTTTITGLFVGAIMAIQINLELRDFGAQAFLGGITASVTIRNVGPVLIAFILSGKVGAYTSAELATMQVTDQMNAIRCLGADPLRYLVVPRMVAVVVTSFLLLTAGLATAIAGGALMSSAHLGVNWKNFIGNIPRLVSWWSIGVGGLKSLVFGWVIANICCYQGYSSTGGAVGVGMTVRRTAVQTLVCIIVTDYAISMGSTAVHNLILRLWP